MKFDKVSYRKERDDPEIIQTTNTHAFLSPSFEETAIFLPLDLDFSLIGFAWLIIVAVRHPS